MPGKAREKTKLELAGEAARKRATTAKELHAKTANPTNKAAMDKAVVEAREATDAENRERFKNTAGYRVKTVSAKIKALTNCASRRSYLYTATNVSEMFDKLEADLKSARGVFENALKGGSTAASPDNFAFSD